MSYRNFREEVEDMPHAGYSTDGYVWRIEAAEIAARADAQIAELESRITRMKTLLGECREVIAWECNELSNDPRGREDEHRRLGRLVDAIDTARAGNGGGV